MKTKLTQISKTQQTLKTVIPKAVQEMMELKAGEYIDWTPVVQDGKIIFQVILSKDE